MKEAKFPMTVKGAMEHWEKHEDTIYRWIESGKLIAKKDPGGRDWIIQGVAPPKRRMISKGVE